MNSSELWMQGTQGYDEDEILNEIGTVLPKKTVIRGIT